MIRLAISLRSWKEATVLREQSENAEAKITAVPVKAQLLNECESNVVAIFASVSKHTCLFTHESVQNQHPGPKRMGGLHMNPLATG